MDKKSKIVLFSRDKPEDTSDDVWDDRALIRAYDRSISKIKHELSKKFETGQKETPSEVFDLDEEDEEDDFKEENEYEEEKEGYCDEDEEDGEGSIELEEKDLKKRAPTSWKVEDLCMAVYSADGLLYPANIIRIFEDENKLKKCIVKYLYYMNEEEKFLDEIYEFVPEKQNKTLQEEKNQIPKLERTNSTNNKPPVKIPIPPPPLPFDLIGQSKTNLNEHDALHSMLLSWFMNGYHTGFYLGLTQAKK